MKKLTNIFLVLTILLITLKVNAQEVNYRRVENAHIIDSQTLDTISSHLSDTEANQELLNWGLKGRAVYMTGARVVVDLKNFTITDTIYIGDDWSGLSNMKVVDTIQELFFKYGNILHPTTNVFNQMGDLYIVEKDSSLSIPNYIFTAKLERTRTWPSAETTYRLVSFPFYLEYELIESIDIKFSCWIPRKQSKILFEIQREDGSWEKITEFLPGSSASDPRGFYFYFGINIIHKNKTGRVTVLDEVGNIASAQFIIKA